MTEEQYEWLLEKFGNGHTPYEIELDSYGFPNLQLSTSPIIYNPESFLPERKIFLIDTTTSTHIGTMHITVGEISPDLIPDEFLAVFKSMWEYEHKKS